MTQENISAKQWHHNWEFMATDYRDVSCMTPLNAVVRYNPRYARQIDVSLRKEL